MNIILFKENEAAVGVAIPLAKRDPRAIHLVKTLHKNEGDSFAAGIIGGKRGLGAIKRIDADGNLELLLNLTEAPPPKLALRIAVGFPRPIQLRRLLRDLSSMGVSAIDLFESDMGEQSYRQTTLLSSGGAQAALIEGAIQSRDTMLPDLAAFPSLEAWLRNIRQQRQAAPPDPLWIACDNVRPQGSFTPALMMENLASKGAKEPFADSCARGLQRAKPTLAAPLVIAIGSERGWSDAERNALEQSGFIRLAMGERALRTETACIAAAALAQSFLLA